MIQLPLFSENDLQPIQKFLHVWTEAERARKLIKKPHASAGQTSRKHDGRRLCVGSVNSCGN